eukprot:TRINITY_DN13585_c0_g1_i1.p1 TRINITY_DN13585_c0_g1~~TRINITY_DN13585_c0_g1_i1.p1  ORF type:complete len:200 (+),score=33.81 TRINITY_DN13585_c0_g1_i1:1-600(+)
MDGSPLTPATQAVIDFLEVFVHSVLYIRTVYPKELFDRSRSYGCLVHRCRSELLGDYVRSVLADVSPLIEEGTLTRFTVSLKSPKAPSLKEDFVFEVSGNLSSLKTTTDFDVLFRPFLSRLYTSSTLLEPLSKELAFEILISTYRQDISNKWLRHEYQTPASVPSAAPAEEPTLTPLRSAFVDDVHLQLFVENNAVIPG